MARGHVGPDRPVAPALSPARLGPIDSHVQRRWRCGVAIRVEPGRTTLPGGALFQGAVVGVAIRGILGALTSDPPPPLPDAETFQHRLVCRQGAAHAGAEASHQKI